MTADSWKIVALCVAVAVPIFEVGCQGDSGTPTNSADGAPKEAERWTCPMHPEVQQDHPGSCPICGMTLVRSLANRGSQPEPSTGSPPGYAPIELDQAQRQLIGVQTAPATREAIDVVLRAPGRAVVPPSALHTVAPRFAGWVVDLAVEPGQSVVRGATLFTFWSPDVAQAQEELSLSRNNSDVTRALLQKFDGWQVRPDAPNPKRMAFVAPAAGTVSSLTVGPGQSFAAGQSLVTIADSTTVWVEAEFPDSSRLVPGLVATIDGMDTTVSFIDPELDPATRLRPVRIVAKGLRPGAAVEVALRLPLEPSWTVPLEALVENGTSTVVFVDDRGTLVPHAVVVLGRGEKRAAITGIADDAKVVITGQFLVDSESRIRGIRHAP